MSVERSHPPRHRTIARGRIRFPKGLTELDRIGAVREQTVAALDVHLELLGRGAEHIDVQGPPVLARGARWHAIVRTDDGEELIATWRVGLWRGGARYEVRGE